MLLSGLLQAVPLEDPLNLIQLGISGAVIFAFLTGLIYAKPAVDLLRKELEVIRARRDTTETEIKTAMQQQAYEIRELKIMVERLDAYIRNNQNPR